MNLNWLKTAFHSRDKSIRPGESLRKPNTFRPRVVELEDRRLLASFYVDSTLGFGSTAFSTFNAGNFGSVPNVDQAHAFVTVGGALASGLLVDGDAIVIAKGTYPLLANTTIAKSLSIVGSVTSAANSAPVTTLIPSSDTPNGTGPGSGWIAVVLNKNLNVSNLTIDGLSNAATPRKIAQALRYESTGTSTIDNVNFQNIGGTFGLPFGKYSGEAVTDQAGVVNVSNSTFTNMGREGIVYSGPTASGTVLNITYTGKGAGDFLDYAVEVNKGAAATVTASYITKNQGIAVSDGSASAGLFVSDPSSTLNAFGNLLQNNEDAFIDGVGTNLVADTSILNAQYNNVLNNTFAVESNVVTAAVFTNNYFGGVAAPVATLFSDGQAATNAGSFLFHKTWVWNGTSAANYLLNTSFFAVGNSQGNTATSATLRVYDGIGATANVLGRVVANNATNGILSTFPFGQGYIGGISVSIGDWDNDYRPDVVITNTDGDVNTNATVAIFDIATGRNIGGFFAFNAGFNGGAYVRFADVNGDGTDEIVVGKGADVTGRLNNGNAAGSQLQVWGNNAGSPVLVTSVPAAYAGFTGGIHVGAGDLNKDGKYEIITAPASQPGNGGRLDHVKVYSFTAGATPNAAGTIPPAPVGSTAEVGSFFAFFNSPNAVGLNVDGGDLDGSGYDQIIVGSDYGVAPAHIETFSYASGAGSFAQAAVIQDSYYAYGPGTPDAAFFGGVRVSAARIRGTATSELLAGEGPTSFDHPVPKPGDVTGRTSTNGDIRVFNYHPTKTADFGVPVISDYNIFGSLLSGIQVGG